MSISEFNVLGKGTPPTTPENFQVERQSDRRNTNLTWEGYTYDAATGYVIYWGITPEKLNLSALMYDQPNYELRALNTNQPYYHRVEAFNENGISEKSQIPYTE